MDENLLKITREIFKNVEQNENLAALIFFYFMQRFIKVKIVSCLERVLRSICAIF
jgi:hypothetical protein